MSESPEVTGSSRRDFLKLVGAAGLAAALPQATTALAQGTPATPPAATPAPPAAPAAPAAEAPSEDALALTAILKRRFKDRLTDAQWDSVRRDFEGDLAIGKRLRAVRFENGEEPDSTFKA